MVPFRDVDTGAIYELKRRALVALLKTRTADDLARVVVATPAWTVRDVLAHVVGISADLNAENFGSEDPEVWTAAQVESRRHRSVDQLADEWDREAAAFEDGLRLFGYEMGSHFVGDLLQHLADVQHALGLSPPPDDEALAVALDFYLMSFEETLVEVDLGAVDVTVGSEHWTLGVGPTVASLTVDRYELFRSLGGRRCEAQIRALDWSGAVDAIVPLVSRYPMPLEPIVEG